STTRNCLARSPPNRRPRPPAGTSAITRAGMVDTERPEKRRAPEPGARQADGVVRGASVREEVLLFVLDGLADVGDDWVVQTLHFLEAAALLVLAELLVLLERLELVVAFAARAAHAGARMLGHVMGALHQLLAALLGERRHRNTYDLAIVRGV